MYIEVNCALLKREGTLIGLSLIAEPQTEAERFCQSFPKGIRDDTADIKCENGTVSFIHPRDGSVSFKVGDEDAVSVQAMLAGEFGELDLLRDEHAVLCPGFKLIRAGMKDGRVERTDLERL